MDLPKSIEPKYQLGLIRDRDLPQRARQLGLIKPDGVRILKITGEEFQGSLAELITREEGALVFTVTKYSEFEEFAGGKYRDWQFTWIQDPVSKITKWPSYPFAKHQVFAINHGGKSKHKVYMKFPLTGHIYRDSKPVYYVIHGNGKISMHRDPEDFTPAGGEILYHPGVFGLDKDDPSNQMPGKTFVLYCSDWKKLVLIGQDALETMLDNGFHTEARMPAEMYTDFPKNGELNMDEFGAGEFQIKILALARQAGFGEFADHIETFSIPRDPGDKLITYDDLVDLLQHGPGSKQHKKLKKKLRYWKKRARR